MIYDPDGSVSIYYKKVCIICVAINKIHRMKKKMKKLLTNLLPSFLKTYQQFIYYKFTGIRSAILQTEEKITGESWTKQDLFIFTKSWGQSQFILKLKMGVIQFIL